MRMPGKHYPWKTFLVDLKNEYMKDNISDAAGSLTYYGVLALFPFLLFLVSLLSVVIDPARAQELIASAGQFIPKEAMGIVSERLKSLGEANNVGLLSIGAAGAIWAASNGVAAVMRALNTCYDVKESRPFWKVRGIAILFTLGGGVLALVSALVLVAMPGIADKLGALGTVLLWLRVPFAAALMMLVWAVAYFLLPNVEQKFKFITPGSVMGVIIWLVASLGFSVYVANFGKYDATYGSLGGVIVMLLWMWISGQVLLLGAEINSIIEHRSAEGKNPGEKTLQGAEARTNGKVSSKYGAGDGKKRAPWDLRHNRHPDGTIEQTADAQHDPAHRRKPFPRGFSPSQTSHSRRMSARLQDERAARAHRPPGKLRKLGFALWGAALGMLVIRSRQST